MVLLCGLLCDRFPMTRDDSASRGGRSPGFPMKLGPRILSQGVSLVAFANEELVFKAVVVIALEDVLIDAGGFLEDAPGEGVVLEKPSSINKNIL